MQRIKASGAQAVYTFLPGGPPNLGFVKAYNENGLAKAGIEFLGTAETDEFDLQKFGDTALGLTTAFHYSAAHDSPANKAFIAALKKQRPGRGRQLCVGRRLGRHGVIHKMIEATGGKRDGAKAHRRRQALKWESPRGPVAHRSEDAPHHAERLPAQGREGRTASWSTRKCRASGRRSTTGWASKPAPRRRCRLTSDADCSLNILIDGLAYGMVLFIIAVGLSVTLG